jgi:hypothetical protein
MTLCGPLTQCAIVLLSFGVLFVALGTPMPSLLSVLSPSDILEEAFGFEGLTLPTTIHYSQELTVAPAIEPVFAFEPRRFDSSLFHPPIG